MARRKDPSGSGHEGAALSGTESKSFEQHPRSQPGLETVIQLDHVRKEFGAFTAAHDADFAIRKGEFFSMLGPSGCGKTTLLKVIAGFERPTSGRVLLEGVDVSKVPPHKRNVNTVFQQYALFPHMSVLENVAFGLRSKKVAPTEARRRAGEMLDIVRLGEFATRRPAQLSGGQQQRVALARALVNLPSALLLDEPLAALDLKLREAMQIELKRIQREVGITFIFVTHDQGEALTMSDRIAVMSQGRVEQIGTPEEIYGAPSSIFVAGFIGQANLLPGTLIDEGFGPQVTLDSGQHIVVPSLGAAAVGDAVTVMLRPERLQPTIEPQPSDRSLQGTVSDLIFQGSSVRLIMDLPGGETEIVSTVDADDALPFLRPGDAISMTWAADAPYVLRGRTALAGATSTDIDVVQAALDGRTHVVGQPVVHDDDAPTFTRRALVVGGGVVVAVAVVAGVLAITGDGGGEGTATPDTGPGGTGGGGAGAATDGEVRILNWQGYIDETEGDSLGTIDRFTDESGISVDYSENFNDNNEVFNKEFQPIIGVGKTLSYDIVCPTYWMTARLKSLGWIEELPLDLIPNHVNVRDEFLQQSWDVGGKFHMPWQAGITGIAYNPALTGRELSSANDIFDPAFKGKVAMLTEMRDSVGIAMLALGMDPSVLDEDGANEALDKIEAATRDGQIRQFTGNEYLRSLESGDFVACIAWSGDVVQLQYTRPDIKFVIPEEGGMSWYDTMAIPKGSPNVPQAAAWMNFVFDPVNAAKLTSFVQYVSPVKGVREELIKMGGDAAALADSPVLFPSDDDSKRLKFFAELPDEIDLSLTDRFLRITGA